MFQLWDGKEAMLLVSKLESLRTTGTCLAETSHQDRWPSDPHRLWRVVLKGGIMNNLKNQKGAIGWILLWLLGIPIPILLLFFLVRGCT